MSSKQHAIISLSDIIPNALIRINSGIGCLTFGILATIFLLVNFVFGATIRREKVLMGFDASSETVLISAE